MERQAYGGWKTMMYESLVQGLHLALHSTPSGSAGSLVEKPGRTGTAVPLGGRPLQAPGRIREPPRPLPDTRSPSLPASSPSLTSGPGNPLSNGLPTLAAPQGDLGDPVRRRSWKSTRLTQIRVVFDQPMMDGSWSAGWRSTRSSQVAASQRTMPSGNLDGRS